MDIKQNKNVVSQKFDLTPPSEISNSSDTSSQNEDAMSLRKQPIDNLYTNHVF
jgi:hypothetical protein